MKRMTKALTSALLLCALLITLCACIPTESEKSDTANSTDGTQTSEALSESKTEEATSDEGENAPNPDPADLNYARMSVTYTDQNGNACAGDILIKLCPDKAPLTVKNFKKLVGEGFYDGLTFHRIIPSFMIQGGDPKGNGTGGTGPVRGEFAANGIQNDLSHVRGVISMARRGDDYDSGSCQFFIVHETSQRNILSLDGQYAAFGYVVEGIEHVDGIAGTATNSLNNRPINPVKIVSIKLEAGTDAK